MKKTRLSKYESKVEKDIEAGAFVEADPEFFERVSEAVAARRKDAVLNVRVNRQDLELIKKKARRLGVKYQTVIAEVIHRLART